MRAIERIPIFLKYIDWNKLLFDFKIFKYQDDIDKIYFRIKRMEDVIEQTWLDNPDWRITQVLVNLKLIPNKPGNWYYKEDESWLKLQRVDPREYMMWKTRFDDKGKLLPKPVINFIKDLKTDHIQNILKDYNNGKYLLSQDTITLMNDILKERE